MQLEQMLFKKNLKNSVMIIWCMKRKLIRVFEIANKQK